VADFACIKNLAQKDLTDDDQEKNDERSKKRESDTVKGNEKAKERKPNSGDPRAPEPLCSLIKPGVARLGGVYAVAGGVRVAPRWSNEKAEGMEGGREPRDRGRLHRGVSVAGTRCVSGEPKGELADRAGWIERVRQGEQEKEQGEEEEGGRERERERERKRIAILNTAQFVQLNVTFQFIGFQPEK